jgi:hypothetical protein
MSDLDGGASAPAESHSAPIEQVVTPPAPISTEPVAAPEAKADAKPAPEPEKKPEPTAREALKRAAEQVAKGEAAKAAPKPDAKQEAKPDSKETTAPVKSDGPTRAEDGKFAPKEGGEAKPAQAEAKAQGTEPAKPVANEPGKPADGVQASKSAHQAPARFSADAKTAWEAAPEPVRAEVARMERELTEGLTKYKNDAKEFEDLRPFAEAAKKNGTTLPAVIQNYGKVETAFGISPIAGHIAAAELAGHDFRKLAEAFLGQTHDQVAAQTEARAQQAVQAAQHWEQQARAAHAELQQIKARQAETETQTAQSTIEAFAADKPRFDELRPVMANLMKTGFADNLEAAYRMADRMTSDPVVQAPAPTPAPTPAPAIPAPTAQTRKGEKSITGAPTSGSNPANSGPAPSIKDALKRALAQAG